MTNNDSNNDIILVESNISINYDGDDIKDSNSNVYNNN